ncbi:uncharacterized protein LOC135401460 isoform X2 [Ornithodoros turicata]|uniref:uncharacterized protein LOC135401460 isoform X2 n=1 Tax=Ornithodoros turicata TaxID=34597 RepID=UPI003138ED8F
MADDTTTTTINLGRKGGAHKRRSSILKPPRAPLDEVDQNFLNEPTEKRRHSKRVSFSGTTDIKIYERDLLQEKLASGPGNVAPSNMTDGQLPRSEETDRADIAGLLRTLPIKQGDMKSNGDPKQLVEPELTEAQLLKSISLHSSRHGDAMSLTLVTENLQGTSSHKTCLLDENMALTLLSTADDVIPAGSRTVLANQDIEETCLEKSFAYFGVNDYAEEDDDDSKQEGPRVHASPNSSGDSEQSTEVKRYALPFLIAFENLLQEKATSPKTIHKDCSLFKTTVQDVSMSVTMVSPRVDDADARQDQEDVLEDDMEKTCFEKSFARFDVPAEESDRGNAEERVADVTGTEDDGVTQVQASHPVPDSPAGNISNNGISLAEISPICLTLTSRGQTASVTEDQPYVLPRGSKDLRLHSTMIGEVECTTNIRAVPCSVPERVEEGCNVENCLGQAPASPPCRLSPVSDRASGSLETTHKSPDAEDAQCVIASEEEEKKRSNSVQFQSCTNITDIGGGSSLVQVEPDNTEDLMKSASRLINVETAVPSAVQLDPPREEPACVFGAVRVPPQSSQEPGYAAFQTESVKTCFSDMQFTCVPKEVAVGDCVSRAVNTDTEETAVGKKCAGNAESTFSNAMQYTCIQQHSEETENVIFPKPPPMENSENQPMKRDALDMTSAEPLNSDVVCGVVQRAVGADDAPRETVDATSSASLAHHASKSSFVHSEDFKRASIAVNRDAQPDQDLESKKEGTSADIPVTGILLESDRAGGRAEDSTLMGQDSIILSSTKKSLRTKRGAFFATSLLLSVNRRYDGFGSVNAFKRDHRETAAQQAPSGDADASNVVQRALFTARHCVAASPFQLSPMKVLSDVRNELKDITEAQGAPTSPPLDIATEEDKGCKTPPAPDTKTLSSFSSNGSNILQESMPSFCDTPLRARRFSPSTHLTDMNVAPSTDLPSGKLRDYKSNSSSMPGAEDIAPAKSVAAAAATQDQPMFAVRGARHVPAGSVLAATDTVRVRESEGTTSPHQKSPTFAAPCAKGTSPTGRLGAMTMSRNENPETILPPQRKSATFVVPCTTGAFSDGTCGATTVSGDGEPQVIVPPLRKSATFVVPCTTGASSDGTCGTTTVSGDGEPQVIVPPQRATFTVTCAGNNLSTAACTAAAKLPNMSDDAAPTFTVKGEESIGPAEVPAPSPDKMPADAPELQQQLAALHIGSLQKPAPAKFDKSAQSSSLKICQTAPQDKRRTPDRINLSALKPTASLAPSARKQANAAIVGIPGSASKCSPMTMRSGTRAKSKRGEATQPPLTKNTATLTPETKAASAADHGKGEPSSKSRVTPQQRTMRVARTSVGRSQTSTTREVKLSTLPESKKAKLVLPNKDSPSVVIQRTAASTSKKAEMKASCNVTPSRVPLRSSSYLKRLQSAKTDPATRFKNPASEVDKGSLSPVHKVARLSTAKKNIIPKKAEPRVPPSIQIAAHEPMAMEVDICTDGKAVTAQLADSLLSGIAELTQDSIHVDVPEKFEEINGELDLTVRTDELIKKLQQPTPEDFLEMFFWGAYDISEDDREFVVMEASRANAEFSFVNGKTLLTVTLEDCGDCSASLGDKVHRGVKNIAFVPNHSSTPISKFLHKMFMHAANPPSVRLLCKSNNDLSQTLKLLCGAAHKCRCFGEDYLCAISGNSYTFNADEMLRVEYMCEKNAWWFFVTFKLDHRTYPDAVIRPMVEIKWGSESLGQDINKIVSQVRPGKMYLSRMVKEIAKCLRITTFDDWMVPVLGDRWLQHR